MSLAATEPERDQIAPCERQLAEVHAFLKSGAPWPNEDPPTCIETHASLIYLTQDRAWKLKKPVRLIHVDQVSQDAREQLCREELRLNRGLSGNIYRSLTPLVRHPDGQLALGGTGQIIDWLIETVRLPEKEMLDRRLVEGPLPTCEEIEALCDTLVKFYQRQPKTPDAGSIFDARLLKEVEVAATHLREMAAATGVRAPDQTIDFAVTTLESCRSEIVGRGPQGLVVEGHGDLRAEHVCLTKPPVIFDRLETSQETRTADPFFEVNALGLECGLLGGGWIRAVLLVRMSRVMVPPSRELLGVYGVIAMLTRARLAADHFRDRKVTDPAKWRMRTKQSVEAAAQLIAKAGTF